MKFTYFLCLLVIFVVGYFLLCKTDTNKCPLPPSPESQLIVPSTLQITLGPYNSQSKTYDYAVFHGASKVPLTTITNIFISINVEVTGYPNSWKLQNYVTDPIYGTNGFYALFNIPIPINSGIHCWAVVGTEIQMVPVNAIIHT